MQQKEGTSKHSSKQLKEELEKTLLYVCSKERTSKNSGKRERERERESSKEV